MWGFLLKLLSMAIYTSCYVSDVNHKSTALNIAKIDIFLSHAYNFIILVRNLNLFAGLILYIIYYSVFQTFVFQVSGNK
jgi:hypothetical protein